jgi:hypothetical protein
MAEAIVSPCPLCGENLDISNPRATAKWRDAFSHSDLWAEVAQEFHSSRSIQQTARALSINADDVRLILQFLSYEVCGCRRVTCVSCFDDQRSEL